ncbi:hypothetical protein EYF80_002066 [Liparis tanakae]|uniref:Uncharacterized protein n=1 Tax=Liparis tanakae TaxID=230148 RepID=A0A4Z2JBW5_9TELE|nr:hypothetical protein EYF80_002066 [Liparis tanakae]
MWGRPVNQSTGLSGLGLGSPAVAELGANHQKALGRRLWGNQPAGRSYLKKVWCSMQTFHNRFEARWFGSLKPMNDCHELFLWEQVDRDCQARHWRWWLMVRLIDEVTKLMEPMKLMKLMKLRRLGRDGEVEGQLFQFNSTLSHTAIQTRSRPSVCRCAHACPLCHTRDNTLHSVFN